MVYNRFARWCERNGYQIEIFTPAREPLQEMGPVKIHSIDPIAPIPYYRGLAFDIFPLRKNVEKYFEQNAFDLIHIATQGHIAIIALRVASQQKLPKISCYHTAIPEYAQSRFIQALGNNPVGRWLADRAFDLCWWYQRRLYLSSQLILVPTKSIKNMIDKELGIPTGYFTRGVDSEAFSPAKRRRDNESEPVTIYVGRISIEKNLELLEQLDLRGGENTILVGDGPYTNTLKRHLPQAEFTGFLKGEELQQAYASADIFVFPSKTDTFGNAVLEAMSSGLPVVVTNELGPKDFVRHGETGFVAESDEEFISYHRLLLKDDELRKRMGQKAREYALTCNWDSIFETQLIGNYRKVIEDWSARYHS